MSRYIIIGAGAVGATLAAELTLAGIANVLIGRGAQAEALRRDGLDYTRPSGAQNLRLDIRDETAPPELTRDDILVLAVKSQDVEAVTATWAWRPVAGGGVAADLPIVTLQNGLAAEHTAARRFSRIYAASVLTPASYTQTGRVSVAAGPKVAVITLGLYPGGADPLADAIAADLNRANILAEARHDILRWKAAKLLWNVRNALELFDGPQDRHDAVAALLEAEVRAVFAASGQDLALPGERRVSLANWNSAAPSATPGQRGRQSTWQSFVRGTSSEVDFLNGEVVALGRRHGVPVPWNRAVQIAAARLTGREVTNVDIADVEELARPAIEPPAAATAARTLAAAGIAPA